MFGSWIFTQNIFSSKNHFVGHICALITSFLQIGIHEKKWFIHKRLWIKTNLHQFQMQFLFYQIVTLSMTKKNRINTFPSLFLHKSKIKGQPSFPKATNLQQCSKSGQSLFRIVKNLNFGQSLWEPILQFHELISRNLLCSQLFLVVVKKIRETLHFQLEVLEKFSG